MSEVVHQHFVGYHCTTPYNSFTFLILITHKIIVQNLPFVICIEVPQKYFALELGNKNACRR